MLKEYMVRERLGTPALELQAQKAFRWIFSIFIENIEALCFYAGVAEVL